MESVVTEMDVSVSKINEDVTVEENLIIVPINYEEAIQIQPLFLSHKNRGICRIKPQSHVRMTRQPSGKKFHAKW